VAAVPVWLALGVFLGDRLRAPVGAFAWASLVLIQPLLEEVVLRGVLQGQLLRLTDHRRAGPLSVANLITTAVFVVLHLGAQPLAWALAVAAPSLVFGHVRERFGSVWPAVALHALYNAGLGLTAWLARS
jgi:membrane protease YdiL (CAAX protease family)